MLIKTIKLTGEQVQLFRDNREEDIPIEVLKEYDLEEYVGWYITADTHGGDYDSEKGAMVDYPITLVSPKGESYETRGGYYVGCVGECYNDSSYEFDKETKESYVIVELSTNYADEFDVDSFWVTTRALYQKFLDILSKCGANINGECEIYFGTNEFITFCGLADLKESLSVKAISEECHHNLADTIGGSFGLIDIPDLIERYAGNIEDSELEEQIERFYEKLEELE